MKLKPLFRKVLEESEDGYWSLIGHFSDQDEPTGYKMVMLDNDRYDVALISNIEKDKIFLVNLDAIDIDYYEDFFTAVEEWDSEDGESYKSIGYERTGDETLEADGVLLFAKHEINKNKEGINVTHDPEDFSSGIGSVLIITNENYIKTHRLYKHLFDNILY